MVMKGILYPSEIIISKINLGAPMKRQNSKDAFKSALNGIMKSLEKLDSANSKVLRSWQISVHTGNSSCPSNEGQNIEKCDLLSSSGHSHESDLDLEAVEVRTSEH